jgi:hypothetical protein
MINNIIKQIEKECTDQGYNNSNLETLIDKLKLESKLQKKLIKASKMAIGYECYVCTFFNCQDCKYDDYKKLIKEIKENK